MASLPRLDPQAATETSQVEGQSLRLDTTIQRGQPATVVKDSQGHVVYPAYVPQGTQSPTSGLSPRPADKEIPSLDAEGPRIAKSDPLPTNGKDDSVRPTIRGKQWATELPRQESRRVSALPMMKRAGTNVSQLQNALWESNIHPDDESSSSSSSSSEDEGQEPQGEKGGAQKTPVRHRTTDQFRRFKVGNNNYKTKGKVSRRDGRLAISVKDMSNTGYLAKVLGAAVRKVVPLQDDSEAEEAEGGKRPSASRMSSVTLAEHVRCPPLNIVIMVIGSRGDAQPFLKVGKVLKENYGHRVRIATHPAFREFVENDSGLEFFSVGGDPAELMAFMVKNPGMIPTLESVKAGDIGRRRAAMAEMFEGFWRACINATDDEKDTRNIKMMGEKDPFVADAIIANPPSFAHIHCAEALGIPLHLMFTFPYTPTQAFPHPLATIKKSNVDPGYTNFISYPLVEMMVWQGLGDLVNDFRVKTLGLDPVSTLWAPGATYRQHVPFTYMWSPGLVPKPEDWGQEIDISGFVFLDLASTFKPPDPLTKFLDSGEPPIYIGFGSIVVDDAESFTEMIFEAVKLAGVRALVSEGWGGLGTENVPDNIFMLENTPHDWLFPRVQACVIHGGAGTTAIALKCGKPTMVVPFFGDQHFWGSMIGRAKAGPEAIPYKSLTAEKLAEGIKYCLTEEAKRGAGDIAKCIELEGDGAENACKAFHKNLVLSGKHSMRCSVLDDHVAVWKMKNSNLKLSALAADMLVQKGAINWKKLRLTRHNEWNDFEGPGEPVTGIAGSLIGSVGEVFGGIGGVPARLARTSNKRKERKEERRKRHEARRKAKQQASVNGSASQPEADQSQVARADQLIGKEKQRTDSGRTQQDRHTDGQLADDASVHTATTDGTAEDNIAEDLAAEVGKGVGMTAQALAKAPIDLSVAVAQGFHNAPRLYGDDTVRRPPRVTGIKSGLHAARYEFVYGIYDGWTGLVRLPARGARSGGGVRGFAKGVGMGSLGFVLKDISAVVGPIGYTLKGVKKQIERNKQPYKYIRRARIAQGQRDLHSLSDDERMAKARLVETGWEVMKALWEAVERQEKEQSGLKGRFGMKKKQALCDAFESVEIAEKALDAMKQGKSLEDAVKEAQKSEEAAREKRASVDGRAKSIDKRRSHDKGRDPDDIKGKPKKVSVTEPITEGGVEEEPMFNDIGEAKGADGTVQT